MIQPDRLLELFVAIAAIDSYYPNEDEVAEILRSRLERVGMQFVADEHRNLLGYWPGTGALADHEPILLCAHMDTVMPTEGMQPVIRDGVIHTDGSSVLGADDKAAVAAIVEAAEAISDAELPHPPVEVLFTVGEDVGHIGSKAFDVAPVRSSMAFVPDIGGPVGLVSLAAPWSRTMKVTFQGRAAHAGLEPEEGRSAICMAAAAIHAMRLGRFDEETTANVGLISGGEAPNIIPPHAELTLQIRSLDRDKQQSVQDELLDCCRQAAAERGGSTEYETKVFMEGFHFEPSDPIVLRAESAIRAAGRIPEHTVTCGGSDANELNAKGLTTLVISVGYKDIHTNEESMPIDELNSLAEVCAALMLAK